MDELDKLGLKAELEDAHCGLNHGPKVDTTEIQAAAWLVLPFGDQETKVATTDLVVPICAECAESMDDDDWVLVYCLECSKSQWIYKPLAKYKYPKNLILSTSCKHCSKKAKKVFLL